MGYLRLATAFLGLLPSFAFAQQRYIVVNTGVRMTLAAAINKVLVFAVASIVSISTVLFLVGATYLVLGGMKENNVQTGKKLMIGSLIGMGVVLGSYTILRTVIYFIYVSGGG